MFGHKSVAACRWEGYGAIMNTIPGIAPQRTHPAEARRRFDLALRELAALIPEARWADGEQVLRLAVAEILDLNRELAALRLARPVTR